jgi:hypothetical protein
MDQIAYFRSHPPRCIAGFVANPTELPGAEFDGHASKSDLKPSPSPGATIEAPDHIIPIFALSCRCGSDRHFVHTYRWPNPYLNNLVLYLSPLSLECAACGKETDLLDTDIHGYDSELGVGPTNARAEGDRAVFECPRCGCQPFQAFVRFEYSDDLFDRKNSGLAGRESDLFSWFSLVGKCQRCSLVVAITDFELA